MKKQIRILALILALGCLFSACQVAGNGPITEDFLLDGKTPKALYGSSINKFDKHKNDKIPYYVKAEWSAAEGESAVSSVEVLYNGDNFKYTFTKGQAKDEVIFSGDTLYFVDADGGKYAYATNKDAANQYLSEKTQVKNILPAFPDNIPNSWFDDVKFEPSEDGKYYTITAESNKTKNHPLYETFYKSDVVCTVYFTQDAILEKIHLNNVTIEGAKCNLTLYFSWEVSESVNQPADKDSFVNNGAFDPDKGHTPGGDNSDGQTHICLPGAAVRENVINATCTQDGSYDEVVYCADPSCKAELSRTRKVEKATGHNFVNGTCTKCGSADPEYDADYAYSRGLVFTSNGDGTCTLTGLGTCTDRNILVPPVSPAGDSVTAIGPAAFATYNVKIQSVWIPETVNSIDPSTFMIMTGSTMSLKTITVAEDNPAYSSLDGVLYNKNKTTLICYPCAKEDASFTIPNGVTTIEQAAFFYSLNLRNITINREVNSIGALAFYFCGYLETITVEEGNTAYKAEDNTLYTMDEKTLILYAPAQSAVGYTVKNGVTTISDGAFMLAQNLKNVKLPESVTYIGTAAFYGCIYLERANIPNSVNYLGQAAFAYCRRIREINIPEGVEEIYASTFAACQSVTKVVIPNSVKAIGQYAFEDCASLASLVIGTGVTSIDVEAFRGTWKLAEIVNHSQLEAVEEEGYSTLWKHLWSSAIEIHTGESKLVEIGDYIFYPYNGVVYLLGYVGEDTRLELPASYNGGNYAIYDYAFSDYTQGGTIIDKGYTEIIIPDAVTAIGDWAFAYSLSLEKVVIGNGVVSIGEKAFYYCDKLSSVVIPSSVQEIKNDAFWGCDKLDTIYYGGTEAEWTQLSGNFPTYMGYIGQHFPLQDAMRFYYSLNQPTANGNYWRYVNGEATPWPENGRQHTHGWKAWEILEGEECYCLTGLVYVRYCVACGVQDDETQSVSSNQHMHFGSMACKNETDLSDVVINVTPCSRCFHDACASVKESAGTMDSHNCIGAGSADSYVAFAVGERTYYLYKCEDCGNWVVADYK